MKQATVSEIKTKLSHFLRQVKQGSEVVITEHEKPVAKVIPFRKIPSELEGLVEMGFVVSPTSRGKFEELGPPPAPQKGASVLKFLLEERENGR